MASQDIARCNAPAAAAVAAVDLFCGAGGLTHGLERAGVKVHVGIDLDPSCKYAYEHNNSARFVGKDVARVTPDELAGYFGPSEVSVLAGCAPCQPFSTYAQGPKRSKQTNWGLLRRFSKLASEVKPDYVTMENVPQLAHHRVFREFVSALDKAGYKIAHAVVEGPRYGLPQNRKRLILLASLHGPISIPSPTHPDQNSRRTVRGTIGHLPSLAAGEHSPSDRFHCAAGLSPTNLRRIRASKPGRSWADWPEDLVATCHRSDTGKSYSSVYGRMEWDKPAPTITTQAYGYGNGRFGHPEQDRAISLREAALLQTFPETYDFVPEDQPVSFTHVGRMIGNAVPVRLGEIIGEALIRHATGGRPRSER